MNSRTKTAFEILQVAAVIGILGDVLLRVTPWGLNVTLFVIAFAVGMITLLWRRAPQYLKGHTLALFGAAIFFGGMFSWRDAIELRVADSFALILIGAVLFLPRMKVPTQAAGVFHYGVAFVWSGFNAAFAPGILLGADIDWKSIPNSGWSKHLFSVLRGVAIVTPILLVFGALFVAADAVYQGWVERIFNISPEIIFSHILLIGLFSWMSAGYLRGVLICKAEAAGDKASDSGLSIDRELCPDPDKPYTPAETNQSLPNNASILEHINISDSPDSPETADTTPPVEEKKPFSWTSFDNTFLPPVVTLGTVEISIILGLINLLFLSFVIVQVPYLFGGMDLVQNTPDFKLAEYARRGFGELVTVSALVLPILLTSHWLIKKENPFTEKLFRVFAGVQIVLLFVIMASAVQRLVLLTGNLGYGLTTIRLYPMIFMSWLAIVFIWFGITVLRGARKHFAWGALWSAFMILGATHVLNPDAFIVKTNLGLMQQGREFDAYYNSSLSDDAIPTLVRNLPSMSLKDRCEVGSAVHYRYRQLGQSFDLRSYNLSRRSAYELMLQNDSLLHQTEGCPAQFSNDRDPATYGDAP